MKFTLAGDEFDLSPESVRARLAGKFPDAIREYWVEVDGARWPVKQVMSLATGLPRTRFQSQNSRRLLAKLGFTVGAGAGALGQGAARTSASSRAKAGVVVADLPELERVSASVELTWRLAGKVVLDADTLPEFPALPAEPGLYRYDFGVDGNGTRIFYIGESQDLARRARNYRGAKTDRSTQKTSRRIHSEIVRHLMAGGSIDFAIATEVVVDGAGPADLRLKSARRLAENAAVLLAQQALKVRVLNIDADLPAAVGDE